jgi:predicted TPR repeat methyltransferase
MNQPFSNWAELYEESVGELSEQTWLTGIINSLRALSITSGEILDVAAGTGIGAKVLSRFGSFEIDALDASGEMLSKAADLYRNKILGNMANSLNSFGEERYDAIVSAFDSVNYLQQSDLLAFFAGSQQLLKKGGVIVFDYSSPNFLETKWGYKDDIQKLTSGDLEWRHRYVSRQLGTITTLTFFVDGRQDWVEYHTQFAWEHIEIARMAEATGLVVSHIRDIKRESYNPTANTHVFVLKRKCDEQ